MAVARKDGGGNIQLDFMQEKTDPIFGVNLDYSNEYFQDMHREAILFNIPEKDREDGISVCKKILQGKTLSDIHDSRKSPYHSSPLLRVAIVYFVLLGVPKKFLAPILNTTEETIRKVSMSLLSGGIAHALDFNDYNILEKFPDMEKSDKSEEAPKLIKTAKAKKAQKKNYYCCALELLYQALMQKSMTWDERNHVLLVALLLLDGNSEEFKNTAEVIGLDKGDVTTLTVLIDLDTIMAGKRINPRKNVVLSKSKETKLLQTIYESPIGKTFDNGYYYDHWTDYTVSRYCLCELKVNVDMNFIKEFRKQYNLDYVYIPSRDDIDLEAEMDEHFKNEPWRDKVIIEAYKEEKIYGFVYPLLMARKLCKNGTFNPAVTSCVKVEEILDKVFCTVSYTSVCRNIDAIEKPSVVKTEFPKELEKKILQRLSDFHNLFSGKEIPQEPQKEETPKIPEIPKQSQKPKISDITKPKPKDLDLETLTDEEAEELQSALNRKDISDGCRRAVQAMLDCRVKQISLAARSNQVSELKLRRLPGYYRRDGLEEFLKRDFERTRQVFDSKDEKKLLKILKKSPKESNLSEKDWSEEVYDKFCKREKLKVQKFHSFTRRHFLDAVYFHAMPKDKKEKEKYKASVEKKLAKKLEDMGEGKRWFKNSFKRFLAYEKTYGYVPKKVLGKCITSTDHTFEQEEEGFVRFLHDIGYSLVYRKTQKYSADKIKGNLPKLTFRDRKNKKESE